MTKHSITQLSPEEKEYFRQAMEDSRFLPPSPLFTPLLSSSINTDLEDLYYAEQQKIAPEESLFFARNGCQNKLLKKLKSGKIVISSQLDLHYLTVTQAKKNIIYFIQTAQKNHFRCVKIIHGKGIILKNQVYHWLIQINAILAFCSATPNDGGTGAIYILLKLI